MSQSDYAENLLIIQKSLNSLLHTLNDKKLYASLDLARMIEKDSQRLIESIHEMIEKDKKK